MLEQAIGLFSLTSLNPHHLQMSGSSGLSAHLSQQIPVLWWVAGHEGHTQLPYLCCFVQLPGKDVTHDGCLVQPVLHAGQQVGA